MSIMNNMSDDDRDMDMDSEDDDFGLGDDDTNGYDDKGSGSSTPNKPMTQAEKRAHHNMLERKRRDHIKDSFVSLRDAVPSLQGEKSSRAQILKKAAEYIQFMRRKNSAHQHDIEDLKRQNNVLENQIRTLERARLNGGPRSNSNGVSPLSPSHIDIKPSISKGMKMKTRSSESENSDGEFRHTNSSSPESGTSSSNNSGLRLTAVTNGSKKLKVLHAAK